MKHKAASCVILSIILSILIAAEMPLILHASLTNELIEESEKAVDQAQEEKKNLQTGLSGVKQLLNSLESAKDNLEDYVTQLDTNLQLLTDQIELLNKNLEEKANQIVETQADLDEALKKEEDQYAKMKKRIQFMYERGNHSYVEMLMSSSSFAEILNKSEFIKAMSAYDRKMLDEFIAVKTEIAAKEKQLQDEKKELEEVKASIAEQQASVEALITAKEQEITVYESDIGNKEKALKEYEAEIAAQDAMIKELEATIQQEKKRLLEENRKAISYDGGQFKWPAPDYTRVSDDYGMRMHPTLKVEQFHNGIDLASSSGSRILAAYDGEVVAADYSSTMGNYIMIDHGDGLYTIYMHASALLVSKGAMVTRGEQIAKVGSTGRSTGPHLHFGVRLNGSYVSPWNYIK
ncbi:MAG: peptidoglycan DD-metalloendopeptidase family protein [Clostridia bacterium]|nr:peptidoglycan DD-metalloendopeptidase family protein [Clostridia bacterium]